MHWSRTCTGSLAVNSTWAPRSNWARSCSTNCAWRGGTRGNPAPMPPAPTCWNRWPPQGHELPTTVLEWRQLDKLKSTYTDALVEQINPRTGRVHTSFAMAAASTGRLSSTNPNLQNIPIRTEAGRKIRHAFVAEPGRLLVSLGLLPNRTPSPGPHRWNRRVETRVPRRPGHSCPDRRPDVRRRRRHGGPGDAASSQGHQFRHHLRDQRVRAEPPTRHLPTRKPRHI